MDDKKIHPAQAGLPTHAKGSRLCVAISFRLLQRSSVALYVPLKHNMNWQDKDLKPWGSCIILDLEVLSWYKQLHHFSWKLSPTFLNEWIHVQSISHKLTGTQPTWSQAATRSLLRALCQSSCAMQEPTAHLCSIFEFFHYETYSSSSSLNCPVTITPYTV